MEDIRFYDWEFHLIHIEHDFVSLNWSIYYNKIGSFEGHFPQKPALISALMQDDYIVCVQGNKQAIVTGRQFADGELIVYGKTCNWLLTRRVVEKFNTGDWTENNDICHIARYIVCQGFSEDLAEGMMKLAPAIDILTAEDYSFCRDSINTCSDAIIDVLDDGGAGHDIVFDTIQKQWVFRVLLGTERQIVISQDNRNAYDIRFSRDLQNYFTDGVYEYTPEAKADKTGAADASSGPVTQIRTIDGGSRKAGLCKWVALLNGQNDSEASSNLKTKKIEEQTTAVVYRLKWGADYELGDMVRLQLTFGGWRKTVKKRVTGVHLWYEQNNIGEEPVFEEENHAGI